MKRAVFYHAGCPVCVSAEDQLLSVLDKSQVKIEVVNLGEDKRRISEAENLGVKSVPALVLDENVLHVNFGASLEDLRK